MVPLAPRYDRRIVDAIALLDDRAVPIAEVARRVCAVAEELGMPRPSYVHLRRYVHLHRDEQDELARRREARRRVAADVATALLTHGYVDAYEVADRLRAAGA